MGDGGGATPPESACKIRDACSACKILASWEGGHGQLEFIVRDELTHSAVDRRMNQMMKMNPDEDDVASPGLCG